MPGAHASKPQRAPQPDVPRGARGAHRRIQARWPRRTPRGSRVAKETGAGPVGAAALKPLGATYTVRFEPVGLEIEVDEDETILNAAFQQGLMLMHGCKEGQCSACKSFLLDGEVDLDRYSTFALPDFEEAEGWTLLCRAHPASDLEVELIHYDEEILRSGTPIRTLATAVEAVEPLTADIRLLRVRPEEPLEYKPGQYVDIGIPGQPDEHRSFSMAGAERDVLEFMIKLYPDGRFSACSATARSSRVTRLRSRGRTGSSRCAPAHRAGCCSSAAAPAWRQSCRCCARYQQTDNHREATYYYGARTAADLFYLDELDGLPAAFVPALSGDATGWSGETGLITDVVERLEHGIAEVDAYVCGPPPMVEAAIALLEAKGVPESHIYFDKFTTSAAA